MSGPPSQLPWYIVKHPQAPGADLKDAIGSMVASFPNYGNAEYFLHCMNDYMRIHDALEEATDEIKELRDKIKLLHNEIDELCGDGD